MEDLRKVNFEDINIVCVDCGVTFVWAQGEQLFYASKGLSPVKRCKACLKLRRNTLIPEGVQNGS